MEKRDINGLGCLVLILGILTLTINLSVGRVADALQKIASQCERVTK